MNLHTFGAVFLPLLFAATVFPQEKDAAPAKELIKVVHKYCGRNTAYLYSRLRERDVSLQEIDATLEIKEDGSTMADMCEIINRAGGNTKVYRCDVTDLPKCPLPMIALVHSLGSETAGHFTIIYEATPERIRVIDGTTLLYHEYTPEQLETRWTGYVIMEAPTNSSYQSILLILVGLGLPYGVWKSVQFIRRRIAIRRQRTTLQPLSTEVA